MKKLFFTAVGVLLFSYVSAQTDVDMEFSGGMKTNSISRKLESSLKQTEGGYTLADDGQRVRFTHVYENLGKDKDELMEGFSNFIRMCDWDEVQIDADLRKEGDTWIRTFTVDYGQMGGRSSAAHDYWLRATARWRIDYKDNRVRAIVDLTDYTEIHHDKTGLLVKETKSLVPLVAVPPFREGKKRKDNDMYGWAFIECYKNTYRLLYNLGESFKAIVKKSPDVSTDW